MFIQTIREWARRNWLLLFSGTATLLVFAATFALSFANLTDLAAMFGMRPAWLWPFCLDTVAIVSAIAVLYARWEGTKRDTLFPRVVMFTATVLSITFNALHSAGSDIGAPVGRLFVFLQDTGMIGANSVAVAQAGMNVLVAWVVGALAPAAACTLLEVLLRLIEVYRRKTGSAVDADGKVAVEVKSLDAEGRRRFMLEEYERDGYLPDSYFADLFGVAESTVARYRRRLKKEKLWD